MNETQTKLLEQGVIILPEEIEHSTYEYVLEALLAHPGRVKLYCRGNGGDSASALAMVDLIQAHGNVIGMLPGEAASSHVTVWAGCHERYIYPNALIGVHMVSWQSLSTRQDSLSLRQSMMDFEGIERRVAEVLAGASNKDAYWWLKIIQKTGSGGLTMFDAKVIVDLEMAKPISEYENLHMRLMVAEKIGVGTSELT
ncbi:MAG: ATP-dependent Clp protease proteolytic subunit [Anaerolineae bacterium]|nr:ATP-dependent Clp protease proteolytic subunit [Anaerolineae bacterium]